MFSDLLMKLYTEPQYLGPKSIITQLTLEFTQQIFQAYFKSAPVTCVEYQVE